MTVTASEFAQRTQEGDTIVARNSKGHGWEGQVESVEEMKNGTVFPFGDECVIYHADEEELCMGPNNPSAIKGGILASIAEVENKTRDIRWERDS